MSDGDHTCQVTAVFPTCGRIDAALRTLGVISNCRPAPDEIIVFIDDGSEADVAILQGKFPFIRVLAGQKKLGPGGARNKLIAAAKNELVASFDDDSFPAHDDYFARLLEIAAHFPDAAIISAASHAPEWESPDFTAIAVHSGCGCVFRKSWFARTGGFVPLAIAYQMEEADLGLQLHAIGGQVVHAPQLRVTHDHATKDDSVTKGAGALANTALLPWLRYPRWLWPAGLMQVLNLMRSFLSRGYYRALVEGIRMMPDHLLKHAHHRRIMPGRAVLSWLWLRRHPRRLK